MRLFIITFLSLYAYISFSQNNNRKNRVTNATRSSFPKSFIGNWKGTLSWTQPGKLDAQIVNMELRIQPSKDSIGCYTWNLIYGSSSQDNRPYLLKPVDTAKGHWVIDELNNIVLDQYWIASRFTGAFTVQNSTIVNSYWIEEGMLHIEFISYNNKPVATTGKGDKESPSVESYGIRSYQKAVLHKSG